MAESKVSISSAVILPDEAPISPRATLPTKRRQSSSSDAGSKRPRISTSGSIDGSPKTLRNSPTQTKAESESKPDASIERRKSHVQEEKRRGQRLFGGLINTLSQSSTSGQQKRRLEIEKRQQEKAKQQKVEDEGRKAEKLAKLKEIRKREQIKFDEKSMRIRHSNMQAMAHFLCTKTEPKLYYKPWELLPADEEHIKKQIADAEALIEREVQEFQTRYPETIQQKEEHEPSESAPAVDEKTNSASAMKETVGESRASDESPSVLPTDRIDSTTNEQATSQQKSDEQARKASLELHNGEVVVEADEDTVIY